MLPMNFPLPNSHPQFPSNPLLRQRFPPPVDNRLPSRISLKVPTFRGIHADPFPCSHRNPTLDRRFDLKPGSIPTRVSSEVEPEPEPSKRNKTLQLSLVFGFCYFQNIVFNIYNKKALNVFPFPWFLASFQLLVGSLWMFLLWSFKLQACPKVS